MNGLGKARVRYRICKDIEHRAIVINGKLKSFPLDGVLPEDAIVVYRIQALEDISDDVHKGDFGGYVQSMMNLQHVYYEDDDSWIYDDAAVCGDAFVGYGGKMYDRSIAQCGNVMNVQGVAMVISGSELHGDSAIIGRVVLTNNTRLYNTYIINSGVDGSIDVRTGSLYRNCAFENVDMTTARRLVPYPNL